MQTPVMTKDLMFKLRLDAEDRERLDLVAEHYSSPAATALRVLIKEKADAILAAEDAPLGELRHEHYLVLERIDAEPLTAEAIAKAMDRAGVNVKTRWFARALRALEGASYITKRDGGFVLAARGRAVMKKK